MLRALHSPPIRELRSAASVKESKAPPPPEAPPLPPPLLVPPPVDTTRSTAEPLADWAPAAGFWPITVPEATVVLDCIVTVPTVRPAPVMALVAAACVWPTTFGTGTGAGGGAPLETTRLTATPLATLVPAAGLWLITLPGATVVLDCIVTAPTVRPALVMASGVAVNLVVS